MTDADLAVLKASLKGNPPPHAVHNLEEVCKRTGLDWRLRHLYLIERGGQWRVELSIDGFRAIAGSQSDYDGQDGPYYAMSAEGPWTDVPPDKEPYAAKVGIRRKGQSQPTYATAKFKDYKAGPMWTKFPSTMLAKCAEMLALRKAFPSVLGGLYGAEEMSQAGDGGKRAVRTPTAASSGGAKKADPKAHTTAMTVESTSDPTTVIATSSTDEGIKGVVFYETLISGCTTLEELKAVGGEIQASKLETDVKMQLSKVYNAKKKALGG